VTFKIVATGFLGQPVDTRYEDEGLKPLGAAMLVSDANTEDEYIADVRDADAVRPGVSRSTRG